MSTTFVSPVISDEASTPSNSTKNLLIVPDEEVRHTLIAALRFWQSNGMCEPARRSDEFQDLATNNDEITSLCEDDVDALVELLNCCPTSPEYHGALRPDD
ncbi:hypothetical protein [Pseudomonas sp. LS-2]|uniref:hypothetical protein n=1 Tax=Pseudomonas sp. LS-2 TaxID=2315859 RepID=UPI001058987B|nr:hypothetical protein [Pseudomonas sp. LS-2]